MAINTDVVLFPNTLDQRKKVHESLCQFSYNPKGFSGFSKYLKNKINNLDDLKKIINWITLYSSLEVENQTNGYFLFRRKKNADLYPRQNAVNNPYYLIQSTPTKTELFRAVTVLPPSSKSSSQTSKKEFDKKVIKGCVDEFLKNPTAQNKKRLDSLLHSYLDDPTVQRGTLTISAGLPSLGKKR